MVVSEQTLVTGKQLDVLSINTIRTLAIDAVQQANSGHPGAPMALAPVAYCLWQEFLRYDPEDPVWPNRDRFVLSNGHASMLLYAMLHLAGVRAVGADEQVLKELAMPMEEIKRFRQLGSKTPGHPESHITSGVETTTGPLGQGVGNSVGMAIAGKWLAANFNRPNFEVFNYNVYAMFSDGDLMEGVGGEAASLAGHLKLSNLCWIYDHNNITLDGPANWSFSEDVMTRFVGYGWNVTRVADANDLAMLGISAQTRHERGARRTMGGGRSPAGQEILRLARRRQISCARGRARALPRWDRKARRGTARTVAKTLFWVLAEIPGDGGPSGANAPPRTARRMGQKTADVPSRRERPSYPRQLGKSPERRRAKCTLAHRWFGRLGHLEQDDAEI